MKTNQTKGFNLLIQTRNPNFEFIGRGVLADKIYYPEMIERLPEIDPPNPGVRGKLFQGEDMQAVFFSVETTGEIAPHAHQAQWGVVLEGELLMTVGGGYPQVRQGGFLFHSRRGHPLR